MSQGAVEGRDSKRGNLVGLMLIGRLIDLYSLVVLAAVIMSWVRIDSKQPLAMIVSSLTDPVLGPLRRALPPMGGLDFSPMVLLFGLQLLGNLFR